MLLGARCHIGLQADSRGRTCLSSAIEQGKWRALQQLLEALRQKQISIVPGSMRLVAECFEAIAHDYPLDFLHYIQNMPLDAEPEVLGDVDASDVMLPSVLCAGSSIRCPKGIWADKLAQYSRSTKELDDLPTVANVFAAPKRAWLNVQQASPAGSVDKRVVPQRRFSHSNGGASRESPPPPPVPPRSRSGEKAPLTALRGQAEGPTPTSTSRKSSRIGSYASRMRASKRLSGSVRSSFGSRASSARSSFATQQEGEASSSFDKGGGAEAPPSECGLGWSRSSSWSSETLATPREVVGATMGFNKTSRGGLQAHRVPVENFAGILKHGSHEVAPLQLVVSAVDATKDYSVYGANLIKLLIEFKWRGFARDAFYKSFALYLIHMIIVVTFNLEMSFKMQQGWGMQEVLGRSSYERDDPDRPEGYDGHPAVVLLFGLAWSSCQVILTFSTEYHQIRSGGTRAYLGDFWNWFDMLYIGGQAIVNVLFCLRGWRTVELAAWLIVEEHMNHTEAPPHDELAGRRISEESDAWGGQAPTWGSPTPLHARLLKGVSTGAAEGEAIGGATGSCAGSCNGLIVYLQSLICLSICIRVLHFFRGSLKLGALAHTVGVIVVDILPLLFLLFVFVLAFSFAMMVLIMHEEDPDLDPLNPWHDPFDAIITVLNIGLYTYYDEAIFTRHRRFLLLLYHFYMLLVQIILLNMLIAVMGESHSRVYGQSELVALSGRAKLILEYEGKVLASQKKRVRRNQKKAQKKELMPEPMRWLLDEQEQRELERMQRICPRWLHVLMPAEHLRGDKEEPLEKLERSLVQLHGKLDAREEQVDQRMAAMSGQMLRLTAKLSDDVRVALNEPKQPAVTPVVPAGGRGSGGEEGATATDRVGQDGSRRRRRQRSFRKDTSGLSDDEEPRADPPEQLDTWRAQQRGRAKQLEAAPFTEKLHFVVSQLGIDASTPAQEAITKANEKMGLEPQGPLPDQLGRLVQTLTRSTDELTI